MAGQKVNDETREFVKSVKLEAQEKLGEKQFFGGDKPCIADFFIFNNLIHTVLDSTSPDHESPDLANLRQFYQRMMAIEHVSKKTKEFEELLTKVSQIKFFF